MIPPTTKKVPNKGVKKNKKENIKLSAKRKLFMIS
jgi:hypothetical protein